MNDEQDRQVQGERLLSWEEIFDSPPFQDLVGERRGNSFEEHPTEDANMLAPARVAAVEEFLNAPIERPQ